MKSQSASLVASTYPSSPKVTSINRIHCLNNILPGERMKDWGKQEVRDKFKDIPVLANFGLEIRKKEVYVERPRQISEEDNSYRLGNINTNNNNNRGSALNL